MFTENIKKIDLAKNLSKKLDIQLTSQKNWLMILYIQQLFV